MASMVNVTARTSSATLKLFVAQQEVVVQDLVARYIAKGRFT
jgi:TolB-like protein